MLLSWSSCGSDPRHVPKQPALRAAIVDTMSFVISTSGSAQVRFHAMEICDQLFQRSHLFRHLTTQHLPQILEHAVGTKASRPLPGPPHVATHLNEKALESIDQWTDKYGAYYQQV